MKFSWNAEALKEWCWNFGTVTGGSAEKTLRAAIPVRGKFAVNVPAGKLRVEGYDGQEVQLEMLIRGVSAAQIEDVTYTVQDRDGTTSLLVDGPMRHGGNPAKIEVTLRVPRAQPLDARCSMGTVNANDVGGIAVHANMGSVEITNAHGDCNVVADMGAVRVALAPDWNGSGVNVNASMGNATLAVPSNVRLNCSASAAMGKVEVAVGSYAGAPNARVTTAMGSARIVPA